MAINYTKIGWDTTKYVNPTNMNQMDDGIKAACDGVDAHDTAIDNLDTAVNGRVKLSSATVQEIDTTGTSAFPISVKGGYTGESLIRYRDGSGNTLGYMGIASGDKPVFYGASGVTTKEIALAENVLPLTAGVNKKLTGDLWLHGTGNRTVVVGDQAAGATGYLQLSNNQHYGLLFPLSLTGDRQYRLPDKTGTIALQSDIPSAASFGVSASGSTGTLSNYSYYYGKVAVIRINVTLSNVSSGDFTVAKLPIASAIPAYCAILDGTTSEYINDIAYVNGEYINIANQARRTYNGLYAIMMTTILS